MQKLRVRHRQAEEIEAIARQQAASRAQARQRSLQRGEMMPPPEAGLLGTWQAIEELFTARGLHGVEVTLGDKLMTFERLSSDGTVTGVAHYSNFSVIAPMNLGMYRKVVTYAIDGAVKHQNICEYTQTPINGDVGMVGGVTIYYYPIAVRVTWEDHLMYGEIKNDGVGLNIKFRAVKLED